MIRRSLAALLIFSLGVLGGIILSRWSKLADTFFEFKLIEIVNVLVALAVAYWITYRINKRLGNENKLRDIVALQIDGYERKIVSLYEQAERFTRNPQASHAREINANFKVASGLLGNLFTAKDKCKKLL